MEQTELQRKIAMEKAKNPSFIISSDILTPTTSEFKTSEGSVIPDISKLETTLTQPTKEEKKVDDFSLRIQQLNESLLGQSTFRTGKEKELNVEELQKTQTDLSARLKAIQNEALAIPLQLQQEAKGRGITTGGLRPLETGRLRENAIQALGISSLLEAPKGNLTTALDLVDRAVKAKFDPIKEQRAVLLENLELIMKSPSYTLAEKRRAEAQALKTKEEEKVDKKAEDDAKEKGGYAVEAAKNGADALTLKSISEAKTPQEALSLAAPYLAKKEELTFDTFERMVNGEKHTIRQTLDPTGKVISETDLGAKEAKGLDGVDELAEPISPYQKERATRTIQSVNELDKLAAESPGIFGRTAALPIPKFLRSGAFRNFKAQLETLKANITFGELTAMREASKTGGALGQVSDKENELLAAALGALEMSQSPKAFRTQLQKINGSITRWQNAVEAAKVSGQLIEAPDGNLIEITD